MSRGRPADAQWPPWLFGLWIAGPTLIACASRLRTKCSAATLILAWIGCAAIPPLVYVTVQVLGDVLPLSA